MRALRRIEVSGGVAEKSNSSLHDRMIDLCQLASRVFTPKNITWPVLFLSEDRLEATREHEKG